jgi:hypothetical protein
MSVRKVEIAMAIMILFNTPESGHLMDMFKKP